MASFKTIIEGRLDEYRHNPHYDPIRFRYHPKIGVYSPVEFFVRLCESVDDHEYYSPNANGTPLAGPIFRDACMKEVIYQQRMNKFVI